MNQEHDGRRSDWRITEAGYVGFDIKFFLVSYVEAGKKKYLTERFKTREEAEAIVNKMEVA